MTKFPHLQREFAPLLKWTREAALPFWGTVGVDTARGGFHERLDLQGRPVLDVPKRLMVQGRQLFVYCNAALLGWFPEGRALADRCVDYMIDEFYQTDGEPGWIFSLAPDGGVGNPVRDGYAHAFALLGLAWYHRLTGDQQVIPVIDGTIAYLEDAFAARHGGYLDAVPPPDAIRRQNPHMHLFEAFIALYEAAKRRSDLAHATSLYELFAKRFFQPATGTLCEYLTQELMPQPGQKGRIVEPGHHYEWVWLLRNYQRLSGRDVDTYAKALYAFANRYGWDAGGFIVDEVDESGTVLVNSRRSWPHTEALKASVVEGEKGDPTSDERAARCVSCLMEGFLEKPIPAGWVDRISADGAPIAEFIPASTLYHVFCAVAEAARATA
jgi:mannose-6-phosphate isomerase